MRQDEAEKLARKLRPDTVHGLSEEINPRDLRALCDHILSGDMKREIENAAWRPISEAPKDGTDVELWLEHGLTAVPGYFISREYLEREYGDPDRMEEGWYPSHKFEFDIPEVVLNPTHFRLIVEPTKKTADTEG